VDGGTGGVPTLRYLVVQPSKADGTVHHAASDWQIVANCRLQVSERYRFHGVDGIMVKIQANAGSQVCSSAVEPHGQHVARNEVQRSRCDAETAPSIEKGK